MSIEQAQSEQERFEAVTLESGKDMAAIGYGMMLASVFFWPLVIGTLILCFIKRGPFKGHWLYTHFIWQIRTIVISFLISVLAMGTMGIAFLFQTMSQGSDFSEAAPEDPMRFFLPYILGALALVAQFIWFMYRGIVGWVRLTKNRPAKNEQHA